MWSLACFFFFFSSRRRHTRYWRDWSSDVCSSDLVIANCIITGARNGFGIQLYPSSDHVLITSNTIVGNRSGIIVGGQGPKTTTNALVVNNIVAFNDEYGLTAYWGDGSKGTGNVAENNLGAENGARDFDVAAGGVRFSRNFVRDPRFVGR